MAFAQKNYPDIQGVNGTLRISQIGCFLTSFCNLLKRLGVDDVAPNVLNVRLIEKGIYIDVDDGVLDDLNFYLISKLYPSVVVEQEGPRTSSTPPHNHSIVRIKAGNNFGTHFCLVDRVENGAVWIVDSYDGKVKKASVYGPIQGWATYKVKGADMQEEMKVQNRTQGKLLYQSVWNRELKDITDKEADGLIGRTIEQIAEQAMGKSPDGKEWHEKNHILKVAYPKAVQRIKELEAVLKDSDAAKKLQQIKEILGV